LLACFWLDQKIIDQLDIVTDGAVDSLQKEAEHAKRVRYGTD